MNVLEMEIEISRDEWDDISLPSSVDTEMVANNIAMNAPPNHEEFHSDEVEEALADEILSKDSKDIVGKLASLFRKNGSDVEIDDRRTLKLRHKIDMSKFEKPKLEDHGLNLETLKQWEGQRTAKLLKEEEYTQEIALSRLRTFLSGVHNVVKVQTWFRMMRYRREFNRHRKKRQDTKFKFFHAFRVCVKAEKKWLHHVVGKTFKAWAGEVEEVKRLKKIIKRFFMKCLQKYKLSCQAVLAFFDPIWKKDISEIDRGKLRRLIVETIFKGWCKEVRRLKATYHKASVILSRMMRRSQVAAARRNPLLNHLVGFETEKLDLIDAVDSSSFHFRCGFSNLHCMLLHLFSVAYRPSSYPGSNVGERAWPGLLSHVEGDAQDDWMDCLCRIKRN